MWKIDPIKPIKLEDIIEFRIVRGHWRRTSGQGTPYYVRPFKRKKRNNPPAYKAND